MVIFRYSNAIMGQQTSSIPQLVGNLATKLAYSLSGSEYNSYLASEAAADSGGGGGGHLARWRGRDPLVYQRMG